MYITIGVRTGRADWALALPEIFLYVGGLVPYEDMTKRRYSNFIVSLTFVFTRETIRLDDLFT